MGGQRQGSRQMRVGTECRNTWRHHTLSLSLQTPKEMDPTLTIRSGSLRRTGGRGVGGRMEQWLGGGGRCPELFTTPFPSPTLSSQNPQNKASPFSVSPTGPSTKVSTRGIIRGSGWYSGGRAAPARSLWTQVLQRYQAARFLLPFLTLGFPPQACDSPSLLPLP